MEPRTATIQIIEYGAHTAVNVNANERVEFSLTIAPKKFPDPEVADLYKVVESQRVEITKTLEDSVKLSAANDALAADLAEARKAIRRNGKEPKPHGRKAPKPRR